MSSPYSPENVGWLCRQVRLRYDVGLRAVALVAKLSPVAVGAVERGTGSREEVQAVIDALKALGREMYRKLPESPL